MHDIVVVYVCENISDGHILRTWYALVATSTIYMPWCMAVCSDGCAKCFAFFWCKHVLMRFGRIFQIFIHVRHTTHTADGNTHLWNVPILYQASLYLTKQELRALSVADWQEILYVQVSSQLIPCRLLRHI